MRTDEAGYTFIELSVVVVIMLLVFLTMMPSWSGYFQSGGSNANGTTNPPSGVAALRADGQEVVEAARQAVLDAETEGQNIQWRASVDSPPYGITFTNNVGAVVSTVTLPPTVHTITACYLGHFSPQGQAKLNCATPATFDLLCFDSNTPGSSLGFEIEVVAATSQIIGVPIVGACH